jgi:hypothetical protein
VPNAGLKRNSRCWHKHCFAFAQAISRAPQSGKIIDFVLSGQIGTLRCR